MSGSNCRVPSGAHGRRLGALLSIVLAASIGAALAQSEPAAPSPIEITGIEVEPVDPGEETLCQLRVELRNGGERPVYAFAFSVELAGASLPVYRDQLFMQPIAAGATDQVRLFNFWTTETGRPRPAEGKLEVKVTLREAQWLEITYETEQVEGKAGKREEQIEVWTPRGPVPGLPVSSSLMLQLR